MKAFLILLLTVVCSFAADTPTVEVYLIRKFSLNGDGGVPQMSATILEIANPTDKTFYVNGTSIESPCYDMEAQRDGKWLLMPRFTCGTGTEMFPLRPGAKMLVTVSYPWEEPTARFRFYFYTAPSHKEGKVVTVRSRAIEGKEIGDLSGTTGEVKSDRKLEEPMTDEEMNKPSKELDAASDDPFAE